MTPADLAWGRIRREIEFRINLAAAQLKAEAKNAILPALQDEFEAALSDGEILSLEELPSWRGDVKELLRASEE